MSDLDLSTIDAAIAALQAKRAELVARADLEAQASGRLLTPSEAAWELQTTEWTIRRWLRKHPEAGLRKGGRWLVDMSKLHAAVHVLHVSSG